MHGITWRTRRRIYLAGLAFALTVTAVALFFAVQPGSAEAPFPACNAVDPTDKRLVGQGKSLFHRPKVFAQNGPFPACSTCHTGSMLTDNQNHLIAPTGDPSQLLVWRSTPSLRQHLGTRTSYLWDGRATCLQQPIFGAIISPVEMGGTVSRDAKGQAQIDAIAAYLLSLQPPGPMPGLDAEMVARGKVVFESKPCVTCHTGPQFTDNLLHNHNIDSGDRGGGLFGTGVEGSFVTPQLLGVRHSAPYFHNGRNGIPVNSDTPVATEPRAALLQVVEFYNESRTLNLTEQEKQDLVEYLMSLGDEDIKRPR